MTGLGHTRPGEGLGVEQASAAPLLEPVLTYQVKLPEGCEVPVILPRLRQLEEEEPALHIVWDERLQEIQAQVMGEVQIEILKSLIQDRFGVAVEFGAGHIVYKETIADRVEGVGHFEPLRHYARSICCWSRQSGEAACSLPPTAVRIFWIGTGRGLCSPIWRKRSTEAC